jgi:hypothetical protein
MKQKKGISMRNMEKPHFDDRALRNQTPPRVAPRLSAQVKNMRVRTKKNSLGGKK